jgi:catechol 2,3-dioxygenase-like lactoylglutathione lyase family enzyme
MIDHIGLRTKEFAAMSAFYEALLPPLGYSKIISFEGNAGFGDSNGPAFWVHASTKTASSVHIAFKAASRTAVDDFHAAALVQRGTDNGAPGLRPDYGPGYYAAFVIDPDGNNLEAVCRDP